VDQLTDNLNRLRQTVDVRVEQLLIKRENGMSLSATDPAFTNGALRLHDGFEPLVTETNIIKRPTWEMPLSSQTQLAASTPEMQVPVPAVIDRSFFRRVMSRFGF